MLAVRHANRASQIIRTGVACHEILSTYFRVISVEVERRPRRNHRAEEERTKNEKRNERDAYVSFLIVTGSTLRYRPREAGPCHYCPIISCITVTVNEVSYYAARRGGG